MNLKLLTNTTRDAKLARKTMAGGFTFHISNCTGKQIIFLSDLVSLFCDPAQAQELAAFENDHVFLRMDKETGHCQVCRHWMEN